MLGSQQLLQFEKLITLRYPKITGSGFASSGKATSLETIARASGHTFISTGLDLVEKYGLERGWNLDETRKQASLNPRIDLEIEEYITTFGKTHTNIIVDGRMAWRSIPDSFKIYFTCDFDERVERMRKRKRLAETAGVDLKFDDAAKLIRARDQEDKERMQILYGVDITDPRNYDYVFDTTGMKKDEQIRKTIDLLAYE